MPAARKVWQPMPVSVPATRARERIMRQALNALRNFFLWLPSRRSGPAVDASGVTRWPTRGPPP